MELIDQVSINALSKRDLLLILKALEYTNENTGLEDFIDLRNNIVKEICFLTETTEEDFINYLESSNTYKPDLDLIFIFSILLLKFLDIIFI